MIYLTKQHAEPTYAERDRPVEIIHSQNGGGEVFRCTSDELRRAIERVLIEEFVEPGGAIVLAEIEARSASGRVILGLLDGGASVRY